MSGNYHLCDAKLTERGDEIHWRVETPNAEADLEITACLNEEPGPLPEGSPFRTLKEARRFAGPLPYTFDYEAETGSIIGIRALRQSWDPKPVKVHVRQATFLDYPPFCHATAILANAFHVKDVAYKWQRGRRLS